MNLKRITWSALAICSLAGCGAVADSSIRVLNAAALNESCGLVEDGYVKLAELNLAHVTSGTRDVSWPFYIESNLQPSAGGSGSELNDFIADRIELSYALEPPVGTLQPASVPVYVVLRVNSTEDSNMVIPLLPSQPLRELAALGIGEDGVILNVTFRIHGRTAGGIEMTSSPVPYPIHVYSAANCTLDTSSCSLLNAKQTCL